MKKYITPDLEIVLFQTNTDIMDDFDLSGNGEGYERPGAADPRYSINGAGGTIVNNNGTPTVIPGGNGGGRQTPLG